MVVTDDRGRYVLPDLPKATYPIWVRGYGLVDSPKVAGEPGKTLNLTAVVAPDLAAAAQYYPAIYWFAMLRVPDHSQFPGTGPQRQRHSGQLQDPGPMAERGQDQWLRQLPPARQVGDPRRFRKRSAISISSIEAWARRLQSGPAGLTMVGNMALCDAGRRRTSRRSATGPTASRPASCPSATPPRPTGVERNVVVTVWDWSGPKHYLHDLTLTDKRNPTVNGNGLIYGAPELSTDNLPMLDPVRNTTTA